MTGGADLLAALGHPWPVVFEEAWASFRGGNFGVGAVLVDPVAASIVTRGRNRVAQRDTERRTLSGNMTAHAEMNAFAGLDRFDAQGLHLYSTLEPCLMCAAAAMQLKVAHVHYAATDEFFDGMDGLWDHHPLTSARRPETSGPLPGVLASVARLLPLMFTLRTFAGRSAEQLARRRNAELAALADRLDDDVEFRAVVAGGTLVDALDHLAPLITTR